MRVEKETLAEWISSLVSENDYQFFITYKGLTVAQFSSLRSQVYEAGASVLVTKNSMIRLALQQRGVEFPEDGEVLSGDTAMVYGADDPVSTAKKLREISKDSDVVNVKGGVLEGSFLSAQEALSVADMPSKETVLGQILGMLSAPGRDLSRYAGQPATDLVRSVDNLEGSVYRLLVNWIQKQESESQQEEAIMAEVNIDELVEQISALSLVQAAELRDKLKDKLGIEDTGGGMPMMMPGMMPGAGAAAGGEAAAEAEEQTEFDVILKSAGDKKIGVIKEVRAITQLGLKEAKALVDDCPKPIKEGVSKEEADELKEKLEAAGAEVELK